MNGQRTLLIEHVSLSVTKQQIFPWHLQLSLFRSVEIKGQFFPPPLKELEKSFAGLPHL